MNPRLLPVMIFVLLMVMAVPLVMRLRMGSAPEPVTLKTLDLGNDRVIRITIEPNSQRTLSLHYHVDVQGQSKIEHAFFGTLPRTATPPDFEIYRTEQGDLIGLAQAAAPDRIIILHDFASGDSWPYRSVTYKDTDTRKSYPYYENEEQIMARGEALFQRLADANPQPPLDLLRTMASRPLSIPKSHPTPPDAMPTSDKK